MDLHRAIRPQVATALILALTGSVAAQPPEPYRFGEVVDVQLVNVEVWVTDRDGNPVTDLTLADFEILEDGEPVEITHFKGVAEPLPEAARGEPATNRERPETAATTPLPATPQAAEPRHLVLYFDQLHLKATGRKRLIEDLRDFIEAEQIAPEQLLILNQDWGLTTEATFGSSREEIDAALDRIDDAPPLGSRVEIEKRLALDRLQEFWQQAKESGGPADPTASNAGPCGAFVRRAGGWIDIYSRESRRRIEATMEHLADTASFLSGVPGVKTMLYVSDSLERAPGSDLLSFVNGVCPVQDQAPRIMLSEELSRAFRQLTSHANANRVTIYSLQAHGLQGSLSGSAAQRSLDQQGGRGLDTAVRFSERDGLTNLAAETGGRAIFNRNDFDVELASIRRDMDTYYSLAYAPLHGGDEAQHRIEVRLRDKKLRLRHRQSYRDKGPDVRMTEQLEGAVYLGLVNNPMGLRLGAGEVRDDGKGELTVPLHIMVPADSIAFLPQGDEHAAHLSVQVGSRDTKNDKGIFEHSAFRIRHDPEDEADMVGVVMELTLPEGVHVVAVGLRDDATRDSSFVTTTLELRGSAATAATG